MFNWSISWKRLPLDPLMNLILKKELLKNIATWLHLDRNMRLCTFSWHKFYCRQNRPLYCIVHNVGKLRSPLMSIAYKEGTQVPIRMYWILNVLKYRLQFFETMHAAHIFSLKEKDKIKKIQYIVQSFPRCSYEQLWEVLVIKENENYSQLFKEWIMINYYRRFLKQLLCWSWMKKRFVPL